jgi:hypothetical protein
LIWFNDANDSDGALLFVGWVVPLWLWLRLLAIVHSLLQSQLVSSKFSPFGVSLSTLWYAQASYGTNDFITRHALVISCLCLMLHMFFVSADAISFRQKNLKLLVRRLVWEAALLHKHQVHLNLLISPFGD